MLECDEFLLHLLFTLYLQQAYTNELENKVHRLEEENEGLKKRKVLYLFNTLLSEYHPHFASKGRFYPPFSWLVHIPISFLPFCITPCLLITLAANYIDHVVHIRKLISTLVFPLFYNCSIWHFIIILPLFFFYCLCLVTFDHLSYSKYSFKYVIL
jgi:hypothetical protein